MQFISLVETETTVIFQQSHDNGTPYLMEYDKVAVNGMHGFRPASLSDAQYALLTPVTEISVLGLAIIENNRNVFDSLFSHLP
jgi:hypothetical protein